MRWSVRGGNECGGVYEAVACCSPGGAMQVYEVNRLKRVRTEKGSVRRYCCVIAVS